MLRILVTGSVILDPEFWIKDPGLRLLDPGTKILILTVDYTADLFQFKLMGKMFFPDLRRCVITKLLVRCEP